MFQSCFSQDTDQNIFVLYELFSKTFGFDGVIFVYYVTFVAIGQ